MSHDVPFAADPGLHTQTASLAQHLSARRERILEAWRAAVTGDQELTSSNHLSRTQFRDHIPQVLAEFEKRLVEETRPGLASPETDSSETSVEHGQQRWQQGYDLREVVLEWGHLHHCLLEELDAAGTALPSLTPECLSSARRSLAGMVHMAIADSVEQFAYLQQKEALRERHELEGTVARFIENGRRRDAIWRESAHDLRGQLSIITSATMLMEEPALEEPLRTESLQMLRKGTRTLKEMLAGALENTQMETNREERKLGSFDAGTLLGGLCAATQPLARERGLLLHCDGPENLVVQGDRGKVQRIAQNLLLNALNYTAKGAVTLSWRTDDLDWWSFEVRDTGPGLFPKDGAPRARETGQPPGEGLGLSIVRRLSELLDARLEMDCTPGIGTACKVRLPRRYTV